MNTGLLLLRAYVGLLLWALRKKQWQLEGPWWFHLRAFLPNWKFYHAVGWMPRLWVRHRLAPDTAPTAWALVYPRRARRLWHLIHNPDVNLALAEQCGRIRSNKAVCTDGGGHEPAEAARQVPALATSEALLAELEAICQRRGVRSSVEEMMRAAAAPSAPEWQGRWERALADLGVPLFRLPSGAGHDAMKLHEVMPQAMLFVRGLNGGISHNPLESTTSDDMQLAVDAFQRLLDQLAAEMA